MAQILTNEDAPFVQISASTDSDEKVRVDLADRLISFEFVDTEKKAQQMMLELDNFDLELYKLEELRRGALIYVSWGYTGNMSPVHEMIIKRSSSSGQNSKRKKKKGDQKAQFAHRDSSVSGSTEGDSLKGWEIFKVEAYGAAFKMHSDVKSRVFENMSRSDVVKQIAGEYGFTGKFLWLEDTVEVFTAITQARMTDAQFITRLAAKEGFQFFSDWDGLHFHKRILNQTPIPRVFHYYTDPGRGTIAKIDEVDINLSGKAGAVVVAGIDPLNKAEIKERATNDSTHRKGLAPEIELIDPESSTTRLTKRNVSEHVHTTPQHTSSAARREADARLRDAQLNAVKIKFTAVGDPQVLAKSICELRGISDLLIGKYYISEIRHKITIGGYLMTLSTKRDGLNKGVKSKATQNKKETGTRVKTFEAINAESSTTQIQFRDSRGREIGAEIGSQSVPVK